jgi:macrolide transport system ATP-binding/permease protein
VQGWMCRLGGLFSKRRHEREFDAELSSHLQFHIDENLRADMTPEAARREALIKLGGVESTKERWRDRRSAPLFDYV